MKKDLIRLFAICLALIFTAQFGLAQGRVLQIINERHEIPVFGFDDCNQTETFAGSGYTHFVGRVYLDKDGLVHTNYNVNSHFTVTGDVTGTQWVINETVRQEGMIFAPDSCNFSADVTGIQRIISRGPLQNDFFRYSYRFTVEPLDPETCLITITDPTFSVECRGR